MPPEDVDVAYASLATAGVQANREYTTSNDSLAGARVVAVVHDEP
jgi:hypothetical protein